MRRCIDGENLKKNDEVNMQNHGSENKKAFKLFFPGFWPIQANCHWFGSNCIFFVR